jgi:phage terminase large subunit-like protein
LSVLRLRIPAAFEPFTHPARYKAAFGGRGSGKSRGFASLAVGYAVGIAGCRILAVREVQKSLKESAKRLLEDTIVAHGFSLGGSDGFESLRDETRLPGGGVVTYIGMKDHTAETVKSYEGYDLAWIEEAANFSDRSFRLLRPTIRKPGSEIWCSWNPRGVEDAVDKFFRGGNAPPDAIIRQLNYMDNPWFPEELEKERAFDEINDPDRYAHTWLGDYEPQAIGAIFNRANFHRNRYEEIPPDLTRIVVAIDPAMSSEPGSDEHGIIAAGLGPERPNARGYVIKDASMKGTPHQWGNRALAVYDEFDADAIIVEINNGGDLVKHTIKSLRPQNTPKIIEVRATRGKHVRAEPIAALYDEDRISHCGPAKQYAKLETQLCNITAGGYEGTGSPDHADADVWALSELFQRYKGGHPVGVPIAVPL